MMVKKLDKSEVVRIREIDRTEKVTSLYRSAGGKLMKEKKEVLVPPWTPEQVDAHIAWQSRELDRGGTLLGAFEGEQLVGIAVLGNRPVGSDSKTAQLVFLHVTSQYRRKGVGSALYEELRKRAKMSGKKRLYISATPSESAVGFYLSKGAVPIEKPDPGLFAKEPDDVHLVVDL